MRDMTSDEILAALDTAGLGRYREQAVELLQPAIGLQTAPFPEADLAVGASKMGGLPDLPPSTPWPCRDKKGVAVPLNFLAQINFADAHAVFPDSPLPASGLLSVFYDAEEQPWELGDQDKDGIHVVYTPDAGVLEHCELPAPFRALLEPRDLPEVFQSCALKLTRTLPLNPLRAKLRLSGDERKKLETALPALNDTGDGHQMLGKANYIQNDTNFEIGMRETGIGYDDLAEDAERGGLLAKVHEAAKPWLLLLQIDSDGKPGWMWADSGVLYFHIHERDLAARNFDDIRMELQCC